MHRAVWQMGLQPRGQDSTRPVACALYTASMRMAAQSPCISTPRPTALEAHGRTCQRHPKSSGCVPVRGWSKRSITASSARSILQRSTSPSGILPSLQFSLASVLRLLVRWHETASGYTERDAAGWRLAVCPDLMPRRESQLPLSTSLAGASSLENWIPPYLACPASTVARMSGTRGHDACCCRLPLRVLCISADAGCLLSTRAVQSSGIEKDGLMGPMRPQQGHPSSAECHEADGGAVRVFL